MNIEKFENNLVAFDFDTEMINATDMLKAYPKKRMSDFLKLDGTKDFIDLLESDNEKSRITENQVLTIIKGNFSDNIKQGTWMCKLLAFKFAAWLDPNFELFVYKTFDKAIKDKMTNQQRQLDYFWDKQDQNDIYNK
jgi:hypothetical protein